MAKRKLIIDTDPVSNMYWPLYGDKAECSRVAMTFLLYSLLFRPIPKK